MHGHESFIGLRPKLGNTYYHIKNSVEIATLVNEIVTVGLLKKIFVKFQTSNMYLKKRSADKM
jgi:hypothetical protein